MGCFLNSPKITALTGARFKSHQTGTFRETYTDAGRSHPILNGLKEIESWDETYVHEMHNEKDRTVLSNRVEGNHTEPYTWVRTHGKGRVFYAQFGHSTDTWDNSYVQRMYMEAIRWATGLVDADVTPRPAPANLPGPRTPPASIPPPR